MAKRNFALVALMVFGALINSRQASAATTDFDDGCAVLNAIVWQSFLNVALLDDNYPGDSNVPDYAGARSCSNTSAAVTTAFRASLIEMNIVTRWSLTQSDAAYVCLSHDLRNCYPFPDPMGPALAPSDLAFIHNSWKAVRDNVLAQMPWGAGSDMSYFDAQALAGNLNASVQRRASRVTRPIRRAR